MPRRFRPPQTERVVYAMLGLAFIHLLANLPARACLWDRDTLAMEAEGKLDTVEAIVGWFDRYPPRYYEMRLERVITELAADPQRLDLYDDAGVACSRLGRHDEAIDWMVKKKAILDTLPPADTADARYRYLSNIGTFHLIRWIVKPQSVRNADLADLESSDTFIAQALELNPDAHFGREKFQLMLIRWLLKDPGEERYPETGFVDYDSSLSDEARKGITGLIELGAAWQSVDTFRTLQECLKNQRNAYLARLAYLREEELRKAGMKSLHPSPVMQELVADAEFIGMIEILRPVDAYYKTARSAADHRNAEWVSYQEGRFSKGMHPDTHPEFWKEWQEPVMPEIPSPTFLDEMKRPSTILPMITSGIVGIGLLAVALLIGTYLLRRRCGKKAQS